MKNFTPFPKTSIEHRPVTGDSTRRIPFSTVPFSLYGSIFFIYKYTGVRHACNHTQARANQHTRTFFSFSLSLYLSVYLLFRCGVATCYRFFSFCHWQNIISLSKDRKKKKEKESTDQPRAYSHDIFSFFFHTYQNSKSEAKCLKISPYRSGNSTR